MKKEIKKNVITSSLLAVVFVLFTVLVKYVDVGEAGTYEVEVGFSSFNAFFAKTFHYNDMWFTISEVVGYAVIGIALLLCALAVWQWIKAKSLKKVDNSLLALPVLFALVVIFYVAFAYIEINYRPVPLDGEWEQSYPSSHVLMSTSVLLCALAVQKRLCRENGTAYYVFFAICSTLLAVAIVSRMLAGVHWMTDIIGGVILGELLVSVYYLIIRLLDTRNQNKQETFKQGENENV